MARITLKSVSKAYEQGVLAVSDVNLEIADGEFVVFVGPSGCGKSTTLRMIAGLEDVTSGSVFIDGKDVTDMLPGDRDIAMVFQNYALYPHMSVWKNMAFSLTIRRERKEEIALRVREVSRILNLDQYLSRKPKQLSGGQRQRVAVGRAIVRQPKVFLFDEPLSNLDAKLRVQMRTELASLHKRLGATMLYVTHDQVEAMTMGDRIVIMKDGMVQQVGSPAELYKKPVNKFVAGFIGSPPMNFFETTVIASPNGKELCVGEAHLPFIGTKSVGESVVWGIRPEHLTISKSSMPGCFTGIVELIEPLGAECHVYFSVAGNRFAAKADADFQAEIGEVVFASPHANRSYYFDPTSGVALAI